MSQTWWRMAASENGRQAPNGTGWGTCSSCGAPARIRRPHRLHTLDGKVESSPFPLWDHQRASLERDASKLPSW